MLTIVVMRTIDHDANMTHLQGNVAQNFARLAAHCAMTQDGVKLLRKNWP